MKLLVKLFSITVFILMQSVALIAQCTLEMKGTVVDADTREPLGYSNVVIVELQKGAATDESGNYIIKGICPGNYTVRVSHLSCESKDFKLEITADLVRNFELPHSLNELKGVSISAERQKDIPTQAVQEITGEDLDKTRGSSLGESLKGVTGISELKTGSSVSKPVIHGLHSNRVLILNNGIRQEGQQWGSEHAPEIDPFIATQLTVIKGANSVRYGSDAIAGVILVEPAAMPDSAGIRGELNLVGFSNNREGVVSAIAEQRFEKIKALSWRLQGTLKKGGNTKTPDYYLKNTGYEEENFSWALGWNKPTYGLEVFYSQFNSSIGIFSGSHIGNLTDLQAAFDRDEPLEQSGFSYHIDRPFQRAEHELLKTKGWLLTGTTGKFSVTYARQYNLRYEYDKHRPLNDALAALNLPELTYEITSHSVDLLWEHNSYKGFTGMVGCSGMTQGNTFEGRKFIPNYINNTAGLFVVERYRKNKLLLEAGARMDIRELTVYEKENGIVNSYEYNYQNFSGTTGVIYDITKNIRISANLGTAWRAPAVNELYSDGLHHGAAAIEIGDTSLVPEKSWNAIVSAMLFDHSRFAIEISGYYNLINDFIYLKPVLPPTLTIRGAFPTYRYEQADATLKGIDAMVRYHLTAHTELHVRADIVRAFNEEANDFLQMMPADHFEYGATINLPEWKKTKSNHLMVSVNQVLKQYRVPDEADYVAPPSGYVLLNAEAGTILTFGKQAIHLSLNVTNLLNTSYRDYLNRFRYYADEQGRNVSLKIKVPFQFAKKN
ncbi:MAG: TonB-dependent receptor [Bacteroidia bacterium]|nr:TonB-dependent receptor [Bacteroidia bacterium]